MIRPRVLAAALVVSLVPVVLLACNAQVAGGGSGGAGGASPLAWFLGCGDPVCSGHTAHPGVAACTTELEGAACASDGERCDPGNDCNALLVCAGSDPKAQEGGCPISLARYKHDITYMSDGDLACVRDDLMATRLATWRYNHDAPGAPAHLGFIIDDQPGSPAVDASGEHVDLYGYTSMAVAALQAQQKQIDTLQREVQDLRRELEEQRRGPRSLPRAR